jgi:hypothetical protein
MTTTAWIFTAAIITLIIAIILVQKSDNQKSKGTGVAPGTKKDDDKRDGDQVN